MNILAFDLGGSGGKLFLASGDRERLTLQEIHRFENRSHAVGNSLYWDIFRIFEEMDKGIRKAVSMTGDAIDSFAVDSFSNDFVLLDRNGEMISPVHCYRDPRTARTADRIRMRIPENELYRLSGNQNALFNTFMQLASMREEGDGFLLDHADSLLFVPDYLIWLLSGRKISEYTISSVSQMYDFRKDDWCDEILDTYRIPRRLFGKLTRPGTIVGQTTDAYNRAAGTSGFKVCAACEHDTASAFLASRLLPDCALISCGTWCLIGTEIPGCLVTEEGFRYNLANEGGLEGHHRFLGNVMGTWLLQESRRYYEEHGMALSYPQMEELALAEPAFAYLFDPDDPSLFSPDDMPEKIRALCCRTSPGGTGPETPGAVIRAVYESLALKFRVVIERLERVTGRKLPVIHMIGGGSRAELLCRFTANACGREVYAGPADATAIGNIAVQLLALHEVSSLREAQDLLCPASSMARLFPENTSAWDAQYARFCRDIVPQ